MSKLKEPTYKRFITGSPLRFDDRNTGFSRFQRREVPKIENRSFSDKFYHPDHSKKVRKGYEQKDYALVWAARSVDYLARANLYSREFEIAKNQVDISDKAAITRQVKSMARWFGADLIGICEVNPNWMYSLFLH